MNRKLNPDSLMPHQACKILGVSIPALRKLALAGAIPYHTISLTRGDRRYKLKDLDAFMNNGGVEGWLARQCA